jgi:hypothetical protein
MAEENNKKSGQSERWCDLQLLQRAVPALAFISLDEEGGA